MTISSDGNVRIGTTTPNNILQVGNVGRLKIGSWTTYYTLIGTLDTDGTSNTRIVISGNTRGSPYTGNIEHVATSGHHILYTSGSTVERMRITNAGNVSCTGSIGCVGVSASGGMLIGTNLGSQNTTPWTPLNIGDCSVANSNGVINFGKRDVTGGFRNFKMGMNDFLFFLLVIMEI
jgi:hypothetical protein